MRPIGDGRPSGRGCKGADRSLWVRVATAPADEVDRGVGGAPRQLPKLVSGARLGTRSGSPDVPHVPDAPTPATNPGAGIPAIPARQAGAAARPLAATHAPIVPAAQPNLSARSHHRRHVWWRSHAGLRECRIAAAAGRQPTPAVLAPESLGVDGLAAIRALPAMSRRTSFEGTAAVFTTAGPSHYWLATVRTFDRVSG